LVLIHGVNDQAGTWASVAPLLAEYQLIVPDLAGHGESAPAEGPIAMHSIVERLDAIIDTSTVTLVGNSMGAWIALLYALAHPERVERLVLESGGGLARPLAVPLTATTREDALTILRAVHGPNAVLPEWVIDALLRRAAGSPMLRVTGHTFIDARLNEIKAPTTLVWGADDGVVPLSYGEALRDGIAGARLHVIEGAAHIPHAQQPARFVECLTATF
jgi:pimeloyl-ACP methyl ester carboxylesterase